MSIETIIAEWREKAKAQRLGAQSYDFIEDAYEAQVNAALNRGRAAVYEACADQLSACRTAEPVAWRFHWDSGIHTEWRDMCQLGQEQLDAPARYSIEYAYLHPAKAVPEGVTYEQCEQLAIRIMGQADYNNSPAQAHPLEALEIWLADTNPTHVAYLDSSSIARHLKSEYPLTIEVDERSLADAIQAWIGEKGVPLATYTHPAPVASRVTVEAEFHKAIKQTLTKSQQGIVMGAFRAALEAALTTPERGT